MEVARAWARGDLGGKNEEADVERSMRALGATDEQIREQLAALGASRPSLEVLPEIEPAVRVFFALGTQWRVIAGTGALVYQGLEYAAVPGVLRMMGLPRRQWSEVFDALRVMESAAMAILNKRG